jgi:hypothetical protein
MQIKLRRMRWAGHVARMGEERKMKFLVGKSEGKRPKIKAYMGGWILGRLAGRLAIGFDWLRIGTGGEML